MQSQQKKYAQVVFPLPIKHAYTYIIPTPFLEDIIPGVRVLAPFGSRKLTGFVISRTTESTIKDSLKHIERVLDPVPLFTPAVLNLSKWISEYYMCGWGEVLKAALPSGIHLRSEKVIRLTHKDPQHLLKHLYKKTPRQMDIVRLLSIKNPQPLKKLEQNIPVANIHSSLKALENKGWIRIELALPRPKVGRKYIDFIHISPNKSFEELRAIADDLRDSAPKQSTCLEMVLDYDQHELPRYELSRKTGASWSTIKGLVEKDLIKIVKKQIIRDYYSIESIQPPVPLQLNPDQTESLNQIKKSIDKNDFQAHLLHGVTGSGKTQVYIESIHHALKKGKTAIVLVPEIALTPQMVTRFRAHFKEKVAVFHSRMSPGERYDSWRQTWEGKHQIVIGPRSAIFAPLQNMGLIVVDEEHEPSYKQNDLTPRYNARDIAIIRANLEKATVVLGSATPSIESYFNATINKYNLLEMSNRIDNIPMPQVTLVDMKREPKVIGRKDPIIFSRQLRQHIDETLAKGEQIILLQNRRGFATILKCKDCGYTAKCKYCEITLTFHITNHFLKCHYCGYTQKAPSQCPDCKGIDIHMRGVGTQRVEDEIKTLFPGVRATRMDMDTTKGRMAHDKILKSFGDGEYDILLGTQMVAKGLDFPNVTLVGVISADTGLFFPDFRAGERTFQLLTQVAGRAGRKEKRGRVIIQSYSPEHYSLYYAKTHDYINLFKTEIRDRKELGYPPFGRMINITFQSEDEKTVQKGIESFSRYIESSSQVKIKGPCPSPLSKIQGNYRWQILFLSLKQIDGGGQIMKKTISKALTQFKSKHRFKNLKLFIDVDPISIL